MAIDDNMIDDDGNYAYYSSYSDRSLSVGADHDSQLHSSYISLSHQVYGQIAVL